MQKLLLVPEMCERPLQYPFFDAYKATEVPEKSFTGSEAPFTGTRSFRQGAAEEHGLVEAEVSR